MVPLAWGTITDQLKPPQKCHFYYCFGLFASSLNFILHSNSSQYSTVRQEDSTHLPRTVRQISLLEEVLNNDSSLNWKKSMIPFNSIPHNTRHGLTFIRPHHKSDNQKFILCHYVKGLAIFLLQIKVSE